MNLNKGVKPSPIVQRQKIRDFARMKDNIKNVKTTIDNTRKYELFRPKTLQISKKPYFTY